MSLIELAKQIRKRLEEDKDLIDTHGPPPLTGQPATDFTDNANDAAGDATSAQGESFFSGYSGSLLSPGPGEEMIDWFVDMATEAQTVVNMSSPSSQDKQDAIDRYYTIEQKTADLISAYT